LARAFGLSRWSSINRGPLRDFSLHQASVPTEPVDVDAISGAFMLLRRAALDDVGPLDEGYFMHCEDLDWCLRFRQRGWRILFVPHVKATHYKGTCSKDRPIRVLWYMHKGMMRFYGKFFKHQYPMALMWLVAVGVWLRFSVLASYHLVRQGLNAGRAR
jgi:GT2 family glycosyltransferase